MQSWSVPPVGKLEPEPGPVHVYDAASGGIRRAGPDTGTARLYVCGITPYDATHLGHANTYLTFDLLNRTWRDAGLEVNYVQNITDVDDPLLERATATGVDWQQLAADQIELFRTDMAALRVLPPTVYAGAVESIPLVTDLIAELQQGGSVYPVPQPDGGPDDLYFRCTADPKFGSVSGLSAEEMLTLFAERGGDPDRPGKVDPFDCLVWLQQRPGEPAWETPLGTGRPGWHIECTAIAREYLGETFDVQGGGSDLTFPHHEMCASQARTATGAELAQSYVYGGMVGLDGEKMSKSKGNLVLVSQLRADGVDPNAIRLALLGQHYREDWSWTPELLTAAEERLARWREAVRLESGLNADPTLTAMRAALRNDLDAPAALAAVDAWAGASLAMDSDDPDGPPVVAQAVDALLGVSLA
ncbi:cysteine--1-D-myo-inosityl 2-amino-2-deoxy-alpha-D-glucopyranoside ligase [Propionibacteriaceae bacterium Y2011]|uniref:cysteine--1-D-myo-inosityl 2-amino-2-deoxy-alpha-D-glucopyranoside ligase n=1 Tax=Microlunatus sp. Y2014 TaxID=3418488 RepID=UPI003B471E92